MSFIIIPQARKMSFVLKRFIFLMRPHCHRLVVYPNTPVARALLCSLLLGDPVAAPSGSAQPPSVSPCVRSVFRVDSE